MLGFVLSQGRKQQDQTCYNTCLTGKSQSLSTTRVITGLKATRQGQTLRNRNRDGLWRRRTRYLMDFLAAH